LRLERKIMRTKKEADLDKAIKNIEQGNAWDEGNEVVQVEMKKPLDKPTCHPSTGDRCVVCTCMVGHLWAGDTYRNYIK